MLPHSHPIIPPYPIFLCPYFTSCNIYAPCVFVHHTLISTFGYFYHPPHSYIPSSMSPNQLTPDLRPHYSRLKTEQRRNKRKCWSKLIYRNRREARKSREAEEDQESQEIQEAQRQAEVGGVISKNTTILLIFLPTQCML